MADYVEIYDVIINKITKAIYDENVELGIITQDMIDNQAWLFADDQFLSEDNLNKLLGIEAGAQVNIIEGIKVNGTEIPANAKVVNIVIPTKLSEFENDLDKPTYTYDEITNKPTLFSGNYNDLTNKPTIPSVEGLASETFVNQKIANLVNSAPETLDTLGEIAAAIQENETIVETLNNAIGNKVDKVSGKSLVSDSEITKLTTIEANANNYVLPSDVVKDSSYVHTDNNYSASEKSKVEANVNARHTHSNQSVLNATTASFTTELKTKLEGIEEGAKKGILRIWS